MQSRVSIDANADKTLVSLCNRAFGSLLQARCPTALREICIRMVYTPVQLVLSYKRYGIKLIARGTGNCRHIYKAYLLQILLIVINVGINYPFC